MEISKAISFELALSKDGSVSAAKVFLRSKNINDVDDFKKVLQEMKRDNIIDLKSKNLNRSIDIIDSSKSIEDLLIMAA